MFQKGREIAADFVDTTVRSTLKSMFVGPTAGHLTDEEKADLDQIIEDGLDEAVDQLRKDVRVETLFHRMSEAEQRLDEIDAKSDLPVDSRFQEDEDNAFLDQLNAGIASGMYDDFPFPGDFVDEGEIEALDGQERMHRGRSELVKAMQDLVDDLPDPFLGESDCPRDDEEMLTGALDGDDDLVSNYHRHWDGAVRGISACEPPVDPIDNPLSSDSDRIRQLLARVAHQSKTINDLTSKLALQTEFHRNANTAVVEMTAKYHKTVETGKEQQDHIDSLENDMCEANRRIDELEAIDANSPSQRKFKEYEDTIEALEGEVSELTEFNKGLQLKYSSQFEAHTNVCRMNEELRGQQEIWKTDAANLRARLDAAVSEGDHQIQVLIDERERNHDLIQQLQEDLHQSKGMNNQGRETLERRNEQLSVQVSTIGTLTADLDGCRKDITRLLVKIEQLEKEKAERL